VVVSVPVVMAGAVARASRAAFFSALVMSHTLHLLRYSVDLEHTTPIAVSIGILRYPQNKYVYIAVHTCMHRGAYLYMAPPSILGYVLARLIFASNLRAIPGQFRTASRGLPARTVPSGGRARPDAKFVPESDPAKSVPDFGSCKIGATDGVLAKDVPRSDH
jgi:hypothetical protein